MAKNKNKKAEKPQFTGCITFDGNMQVRLLTGEYKTIRTDLGGLKLQKADPNKELLVLTRNHVGFDEIDTGYIVRAKIYDDGNPPYFGLKHDPDADNWACHNYCDVIAWGYADGGLNDPTLFYSCQSTVEEEIDREKRRAEKGMKTHAERLAEMEDEMPVQKGVTIKFRHKDGTVDVETDLPNLTAICAKQIAKHLEKAAKNFLDFTEENPDIKEMHYRTELTVWEKDKEDEP